MIKRILGVLWDILEVVIIIYVIFVTACILFRNDYGYTQFSDYTLASLDKHDAKYIKNAKEGNLLIVRKTKDIEKGDYIYYYAVINEQYGIRGGIVTGITKDDYNNLYNIDTNISGEKIKISVYNKRVLGKYSNQISNLGDILKFLETRVGFLIFVLLPIMLVFVYQIYVFVVLLNYEKKETIDKLVNNQQKEGKSKKEDDSKKEDASKNEEKVKKDDDGIEIL